MRFILLSTAMYVLLMLQACSTRPSEAPERTEAEHYAAIRQQIERKNFLNVIEEIRELEARFPYGDYAQQIQLDMIHVQFRSLDYAGCVAAATRFMRNYPASAHMDYVLYMRGLANYNMDRGIFDRILGTDRSSQDMSAWRDAFDDFSELVRRYPDSSYAADALSRMTYIRNQLAKQELHAARYYARRRAFIAAANRAQYVVRHFQETPSVPEALAVLSRAYHELDQPDLARKSRRLLQHNWPDSEFLSEDGKVVIPWWPRHQRTWLRLLTFDLME